MPRFIPLHASKLHLILPSCCLSIAVALTSMHPAQACNADQSVSSATEAPRFDLKDQPVEVKGKPSTPPHAITLSAQASREVAQDRVQLTVFYEHQADDPAVLTTVLKRKTEQALGIAKSVKEVSVQTRNFTVYPKLDSKGRANGWQGRTELLLECTDAQDMTPIGRLAGQLAPIMSISQVRFSLSPKAEQAAYAQLVNEAIAAFRKDAQNAAEAFGYPHYALADIAIHRNTYQIQGSRMMAATSIGIASETTDIPIAQGKTTLSITVSGVIHVLH